MKYRNISVLSIRKSVFGKEENMYPNLNAELTRNNKKQSDIVECLNLNSSMVSDKRLDWKYKYRKKTVAFY